MHGYSLDALSFKFGFWALETPIPQSYARCDALYVVSVDSVQQYSLMETRPLALEQPLRVQICTADRGRDLRKVFPLGRRRSSRSVWPLKVTSIRVSVKPLCGWNALQLRLGRGS